MFKDFCGSIGLTVSEKKPLSSLMPFACSMDVCRALAAVICICFFFVADPVIYYLAAGLNNTLFVRSARKHSLVSVSCSQLSVVCKI